MRSRALLILAAVALTAPLAACGPYQLSDAERMNAELGARDYADRAASDFVSVSGQDSDKDGYVTATIRARASGHAEAEILCAYKTRGCKRKS